MKHFQDFPGAQFGHFIWLEEQRSSAYEEPFNDAIIFINSKYRSDRPMRRLVGAKELMHVFDGPDQRTNTEEKFKDLLLEIESNPVSADFSDQYAADRFALWKATIALVPPWIRDEFKAAWDSGDVKAPEIATRLWLPESAVIAAMGPYYDRVMARLLPQ